MGTAILTFLSNLCSAAGALIGLKKQRDAENNTQPMQDNAAAKTDREIKDQAAADVKSRDIDTLRKDLAQ